MYPLGPRRVRRFRRPRHRARPNRHHKERNDNAQAAGRVGVVITPPSAASITSLRINTALFCQYAQVEAELTKEFIVSSESVQSFDRALCGRINRTAELFYQEAVARSCQSCHVVKGVM